MGLRWMTDPRTPALLLKAAVRLRPRWRLVRVLNPIVNLSASAAYGFRLSASGIALRARSRRLPKTGSHMTQRWREMDSNFRFRENRSSIEASYVVQTAALLSSNSVAHIEALRRAGLPAR